VTVLVDPRIAARNLARSPGFTAVAVGTLALAIGANTAVFSLVDAALLRALPYREPGALVQLWDQDVHGRHEASWLDYVDWTKQATAFTSLGGYQTGSKGTLREGADDKVVRVGRATASFFATLGVAPALGRFFLPEEDTGGEPAAVLSHEVFGRLFGGDRSVVGRSIVLSGSARRVVGVLPKGFHFAPYGGADVWLSLRPGKGSLERRHFYWLRVVGRLKPGVTLAGASADMKAVASRLALTYPASNGTVSVNLVRLKDELLGPTRPILLALFGAVAFVLLVACANIAGLLLVRGAARRRELAVRVALGAGRRHLLAQAFGEGLVLSLAGGAVGLLLSRWTVALLVAGIPEEQRAAMPYLADLTIHPGIVLFTLGVSFACAVLFASVPAALAARTSVAEALKGSELPGRLFGPREVFVAFQITLALALLTGAGLLVRSTRALFAVDPGFDTSRLLAAEVSFPGRLKDAELVAFHDRVLAAVRALPGVRAAATVDVLPLGGGGSTSRFAIEGRPPAAPGHEPEADTRAASPTYFADTGMRILAGRAFTDSDRADAPKVVIVNETLARQAFGKEGPVGKRLRFTFDAAQPWREVVGVVADARLASLEEMPHPAIYDPFAQDSSSITNLLVRTSTDPEIFAPTLRRALRALDPDVGVRESASMERVVERAPSTFRRQYPARVVGVFSLLALVLAVLGIYGVTSFAVARRTREIGIRVAVGARPRDVVSLVVSGGARLAAIGVPAGLLASFVVGRALSSLLFGVAPGDVPTLATAVASVVGAALLATLVPAVRALRVEPTVALRTE
jgi:putative ABC transport system permease protein